MGCAGARTVKHYPAEEKRTTPPPPPKRKRRKQHEDKYKSLTAVIK